MSVQQDAFKGFANPVDPTPAELRAWAYHPDESVLKTMPQDWDLLVSGDPVGPDVFVKDSLDPTIAATLTALVKEAALNQALIDEGANPARVVQKPGRVG